MLQCLLSLKLSCSSRYVVNILALYIYIQKHNKSMISIPYTSMSVLNKSNFFSSRNQIVFFIHHSLIQINLSYSSYNEKINYINLLTIVKVHSIYNQLKRQTYITLVIYRSRDFQKTIRFSCITSFFPNTEYKTDNVTLRQPMNKYLKC